MLSLQTLSVLARLPYALLQSRIWYYLFGGEYRKYKDNLEKTLHITKVRTVTEIPPLELGSFTVPAGKLFETFATTTKPFVKSFNNFGKRYNENTYWLHEAPGRTKSDPVLLYLHGGAYVVTCGRGQLVTALSLFQLLEPKKRKNLSYLFLDYNVASKGHTAPEPLNQLHESYQKIVEEFSNVILLGDSAGSNLAIIFLQKLKQVNNSSIPYPGGILLFIPWVKLKPDPIQNTPGHSFYENRNRDLLKFEHFHDEFLSKIIGNEPLDSLTISPGNKKDHTSSDWEGISTFKDPKSDVFVLFGEDEIFRDDVLQWAEIALGVPFFSNNSYGDSNNKFIPEKHAFIQQRGAGQAHVELYIEPWGTHAASFSLDYLPDNLLNKSDLSLKDVDQEKYFGVYHGAKFLNDIL